MRGPKRAHSVRLVRASVVLAAVLLGGWSCALVTGVDFDSARVEDADGDVPGAEGGVSSSSSTSTSSGSGPACPNGQKSCNGSCVDTKTSLVHCGGCNQPCADPNADASCTDGVCTLACKPGFGDCTNTPPKSCTPLPKWYVDSDGDGWGTSVSTTGCTAPPGHAARTGDCLDTNAAVHPEAGAFAVPYTGPTGLSFDYDCDGVETEEDAGRPHFSTCGVSCNALGTVPAPLGRTGPGIDDFCGSSGLEVCAMAPGCRQLMADGGVHIPCR